MGKEKKLSDSQSVSFMFRNHPFRVVDDEKMEETVRSVKQIWQFDLGFVRPLNTGGYEVIAGHRRWRACELAGLKKKCQCLSGT